MDTIGCKLQAPGLESRMVIVVVDVVEAVSYGVSLRCVRMASYIYLTVRQVCITYPAFLSWPLKLPYCNNRLPSIPGFECINRTFTVWQPVLAP